MGTLAVALIAVSIASPILVERVRESLLRSTDARVDVSDEYAGESLRSNQGCAVSPTQLNATEGKNPVKSETTSLVVGLDYERSAGLSELEGLVEDFGGIIVNEVSTRSRVLAVVVEISRKLVSEFAEKACGQGFSYVEPRREFTAQFLPDDPYWDAQWNLRKIQADWAWNITMGSSDILVAVLDTGIDWHHPDLVGNYVALGYDWVNGDADPMDDSGHGTHCAGIIAAVSNNSLGISGLAQVRVMAEKVLSSQGHGYSDWIADGIIHAVEQGATIISMSLGDYENSEVTYEAIKYAYESGVLIIAAAGNDNTGLRFYPAAYDEVVAVTATDSNDSRAAFSNFGEWVELAAPGVEIFSTFLSNSYTNKSGTSMACPHVTGLAALVLSAHPNLTANFVRLLLRHTTEDLGEPNFDIYFGYGRINARTALQSPSVEHELIAFRLRTPPYLKLGGTNLMTAEVFNFGSAGENDVLVRLYANNTLVWSRTIDFLASYTSVSVNIEWAPAIRGLYNVTFYVVPASGETNMKNNDLTRSIYAGSPVKAAVLCSSGTTERQAIENWDVLNSQWELFGGQMVYVDYSSLNKENITYQDIASTEADVLIISEANEREFKNYEIEAVDRYVREGHGLIVTGDSFNEDVLNNKQLAQLVGLSVDLRFRRYPNETDMLQIVDLEHSVFEKVPNPLVFPSLPAVVPSEGRWDSTALEGGYYLALGFFNESAFIAHKGLLYMSLTLEMIPPQYHHHLQLLYNSILWSRYEKPSHNLAVALDCPRYLQPLEQVLVNASVMNMGRSGESYVQFHLAVDGNIVRDATVSSLPSSSSYSISYAWTAEREGRHNFSVYAVPVAGEDQTFDNSMSRIVSSHFGRFVLWDNTHSRSTDVRRGDYVTVCELLKAEGFVIDELNYGDFNYALLLGYDVLVLPAPKLEFSSDEVAIVLEWVSHGGSVLVIVDTGFDQSLRLLTLPYGVQIYREDLTSQGTTRSFVDHPITDDVKSIYYGSPERIEVNAPSRVLAWVKNGIQVYRFLAATDNREIVVLSDNHVLDNKGISRADNEQLISNIFHWLGLKKFREHDIAVTLTTPDFVQRGDTVLLNVTVRNLGANDEALVEAYLFINDALIRSEVALSLLSGQAYSLSYAWTPPANGEYNVSVSVLPVTGEDFAANNFVSRNVSVFLYERYYFPDKWIQIGEPMGWHSDNQSWNYTLPFSFPFYDMFFNTMYVSSNGLITFLGPDESHSLVIDDLKSKMAIAPAWHDWTTQEPFDIYIGKPDQKHMLVRWNVCDKDGVAANFAAQLGEDGVIQLFYGYSNMTATVAIGVSNGKGHMLAECTTSVNRIHTIVFSPFKLEHEIGASVETPSTIRLGTSVMLNATVFNLGTVNESMVTVQLIVNGSTSNSTTVAELNVGAFRRTNLLWSPEEPGRYNITAYAPPLDGEVYIGNNVDSKIIYVLTDTTTYLSPHPERIKVGVGSSFTLDVVVNSVENLYAWQVRMYYDSTILRCVKSWVPDDNVFADKNPIIPEPLIEENLTMVGATLAAESPFAGTGTLCKIRFLVEGSGNTTLLLDRNETFLLDPSLKFVNCTLVDGFVEAVFPDFDFDGEVGESDLATIAEAFGSRIGDGNWNVLCDVNHDSKIDILDVAITARAFGRKMNG